MILLATIALQSAAVPPARAAAIEQAILDLCPRILAGTLSLSDARQLRPFGYRPVAGRDGEPRALRGTGNGRIYLIFRPELDQWRCAVVWGGPDSRSVLGVVAARARRRGYSAEAPSRVLPGLYGLHIDGDPPRHNLFATLHWTTNRDVVFGGIDLAPHGGAVVDLQED